MRELERRLARIEQRLAALERRDDDEMIQESLDRR
jgi:hypothetical protein